MAIPELHIVNPYQGAFGSLQPAELVGGTTINSIGNPIAAGGGEAVLSGNLTYKEIHNRVVEYRGKIYVLFRGQSPANQAIVSVYDRASPPSWGTVLASGLNTAYGDYSGLYIASTGSAQRLFFAHRDGTGNMHIRWTDNGSSWNDTGTLGLHPLMGRGPGVMFNNKLYLPYYNTSGDKGVTEIDPIAGSFSKVAAPWVMQSTDKISVDMCVLNDRLYALVADTFNTGDFELYEFTGSGWSSNTSITSDNRIFGYPNVDEGQCHLFKDPNQDALIAVVNGSSDGTSTNSGSMAFELTPSGGSFSVSDITNTVIPAGLRPGVRGASNDHTEDRWYGYASNDSTPGSPEHFLFFAAGPAPGTGYSVYTWVNASSVMTLVGAGPSTQYSLPNQKFGGGLRINRGVGNQCVIESAAAVLGGYRVSYRVYGTQSSQTVRLYYSTDQEVPSSQATISAQTGGGGISGGNAVTGVTGDDGVTLFTLDWDLSADGIGSGDASHLMLDIG